MIPFVPSLVPSARLHVRCMPMEGASYMEGASHVHCTCSWVDEVELTTTRACSHERLHGAA